MCRLKDQSCDGHMSSRGSTVEIVTRSGRRRFNAEQKLAIVWETLEAGATVGAIAGRHGLPANLVYTWRKRALAGAMAGFVPVEIGETAHPALSAPAVPVVDATAAADTRPPVNDRGGAIEIELPNGCRLRVGGDVDAGALRRVLSALGTARG